MTNAAINALRKPNIILVPGAGENSARDVSRLAVAETSLQGKGFSVAFYSPDRERGPLDRAGVLARVDGIAKLAESMGAGVAMTNEGNVRGPSTSVIGLDRNGAALGVLTLVQNPDLIDYAVGVAGQYHRGGIDTSTHAQGSDGAQAIAMVEGAVADLSNQPGDGDRMLTRILTLASSGEFIPGVTTIFGAKSGLAKVEQNGSPITAIDIITNTQDMTTIVEFLRGPQVGSMPEVDRY